MKGYNSTTSGNESDSPATGRDGDAEAPAPDSRRRDENERPAEYGGRRKGLEPTRYGDWEKDGRCIDF